MPADPIRETTPDHFADPGKMVHETTEPQQYQCGASDIAGGLLDGGGKVTAAKRPDPHAADLFARHGAKRPQKRSNGGGAGDMGAMARADFASGTFAAATGRASGYARCLARSPQRRRDRRVSRHRRIAP